MKRLCTVCARGGSKGLPDKNILELAGKPLIAHTLSQAVESGLFDAIAVSSDSDRILETAQQWGADHLVKRPHEFADDHCSKLPAIRHCTEEMEKRLGVTFDVIVDPAVTSPLRTAEDIQGAVALRDATGAPIVLSASPAKDSPYFNIVEVDAQNRLHLSCPPSGTVEARQDAPECFALNGAVYVRTRDALFEDNNEVVREECRLYIMPEERSLDIDTENHFNLARLLMNIRQPYR